MSAARAAAAPPAATQSSANGSPVGSLHVARRTGPQAQQRQRCRALRKRPWTTANGSPTGGCRGVIERARRVRAGHGNPWASRGRYITLSGSGSCPYATFQLPWRSPRSIFPRHAGRGTRWWGAIGRPRAISLRRLATSAAGDPPARRIPDKNGQDSCGGAPRPHPRHSRPPPSVQHGVVGTRTSCRAVVWGTWRSTLLVPTLGAPGCVSARVARRCVLSGAPPTLLACPARSCTRAGRACCRRPPFPHPASRHGD